MKKRKLLPLIFTVTALTILAGCSTDSTKNTTVETTEASVDYSTIDLPQLDETVHDDESLVKIVTTEGDIEIKLFPKYAPKAVENFIEHAKEGYYDNTIFHRVVNEFMIQGGDPEGTGMGGESIWKKGFTTEFSENLYHIRGALAMARSTSLDSQGSQFFIVQNTEDVSGNLAKQFTPERIIEAYKKGGTPSLDGQYTVFGQVTKGMDVVDKIATAKVEAGTSGEVSTPVKPVTVKTIEVLKEAKA